MPSVGGLSFARSAGVPVNGTASVFKITETGGPTAGSYYIIKSGIRSAAIPVAGAASAMQTALQAMANVGTNNLTVARSGAGSAGSPYVFTCTYAGALIAVAQPVPTFEIVTALSGGTNPTVTILQDGSGGTVVGVTASAFGATPGALYLDTTNGDVYVNNGSLTQPSWSPLVERGLGSLTMTSADYTATTLESQNSVLKLSGTLGAGRALILPATVGKSVVIHNAADQIVTVKTTGGSGVAVGIGKKAVLYCDGSDYVRVTADA